MWGKATAQRALVMVGTAVISIAGLSGGAAAQPGFEPTFSESQLCQTVDFSDVRLRTPNDLTTGVVAVSLPAGTLNIPEAVSWDGYPGRAGVPTQSSERWQLEFLDASGSIIATSDATPDVPDGVERGEWIGSLGSVTLPAAATGVQARLRADLPANDTPNSVHVSGVTLCFNDPALVPPICVDGAGNRVPAEADGTCAPAGPSVPNPTVCTDAGGNAVTPNADGSCPTPTAPKCTDAGGNAVTPNSDGSCPVVPILPKCVDSNGNAVTANADGTCPSSSTAPRCVDANGNTVARNADGTCPAVSTPAPAGPTITPQGSAPVTPAAPAAPRQSSTGGQLPVTGATTGIYLSTGLWLVAAGATATLYARQRRLA